MDISARDYEIGRQPRKAAKFLARYKDRILFGTDMGNARQMYQGHGGRCWKLLNQHLPGRVWRRIYGLELPPPVLESLYRGNARKILNWETVISRKLVRGRERYRKLRGNYACLFGIDSAASAPAAPR